METWLITGIGRGIGQEMARQLLARGDAVIGTVRDGVAAAKATAALVPSDPAKLKILTFDVRDGSAIAQAAKTVDITLDVIVNNSGVIGPESQSALAMDFDGFLDTLAVNTLGPLRISEAFLPHLSKSKRPRIVTISSGMGSLSSAASDHVAYRASKAAVNKVMQCLATDLTPKNVIAIAAHPGWVRTDMGGAGAAIDVSDSASGLIRTIDALQPKQSGTFLDYRGKTLDW